VLSGSRRHAFFKNIMPLYEGYFAISINYPTCIHSNVINAANNYCRRNFPNGFIQNFLFADSLLVGYLSFLTSDEENCLGVY
jgi:hypothetical protein